MPGADELAELLAFAERSPDVLGAYVFGSRGRADGLPDERSDWDVCVVLRDGADVAAFDADWPYRHGAPVEVARVTLSELAADDGPLYEAVDLRLDKSGELRPLLAAKGRVDERVAREALDAYVNATYRSLRYAEVGAAGARLDAAESVPPLLTFLFALDGRGRPFNKYVADALPEGFGLERLTAVLDGDGDAQRALFRDVELLARARGHGDVIDAWEPDVAWLRGESGYRR
jgi:predicted nucleotidyltransferase